jgi:putative hemolysin
MGIDERWYQTIKKQVATSPSPDTASLNMANPASVNCAKQGGTLTIKTLKNGQVGYCNFPNGKTCEEWALFRKECQP